jgi:hypothetical protein
MRSFDATPHRGQIVTLRASVRAGDAARVQMWLRVDRTGDAMGFFDNMDDRPVVGGGWQDVEIKGLVADDAQRIAFGFLLITGDELWFDDVQLTFPEAGEGDQALPPAPLTGRALANVAAFARLVGYVRWFHPSDAVAGLDWERFTVDGMVDVERAADAAALAADLRERFAMVAPTLRIEVTDGAKATELLPPDSDGPLQCVAWVHDGVGIAERSAYRSERTFRPLDDRGELPDPRTPLRLDLDGGITCWLPVALFARDGRALPESSAPPSTRPRFDANDRATRLAAVALAWNVFQHFYPYFDVVDVTWQARPSPAKLSRHGSLGFR